MAAQYAYVDNNAKVKKHHMVASQTVNWVQSGQKVKIIGQWNNWYKLQIPGPDGWVRANVIDFDYYDDDDYYPAKPGYGFGSNFCVEGKNAQFVLGTKMYGGAPGPPTVLASHYW